MPLFKQNQLSWILMITSILALIAFQSIWLKQSFKEEKQVLQDKIDRTLLEAVRSLEDSLIHKIYVTGFSDRTMIGTREAPKVMLRSIITDTINQEWVESAGNEASDSIRIDIEGVKQMNRKFSLPSESRDEQGILSSISLFMTLGDTVNVLSTDMDSSQNIAHQNIVKDKFSKLFESNRTGLPFQFISDKSEAASTSTLSQAYRDVLISKAMFVEVQDVTPYLLKQILPQALFSFLVLSGIIIAYLLIYRNLKQQRRLTELKNDLISNITHELKTPISTVAVAIEALENFDAMGSEAKRKSYLEISRKELERLNILVDNVLHTALLDQKEISLQKEDLNIGDLVKEILSTWSIQLDKLGAKVKMHAGEGLNTVFADRIHITNVVHNLIDNAIKYANGQPDISIEVFESGQKVSIEITDKGIGIPKEYQKQVFEKFFRIPAGDQHNVKGHGLGLNYVYKVIEAHEGRTTLSSSPNQGTSILIELPMDGR